MLKPTERPGKYPSSATFLLDVACDQGIHFMEWTGMHNNVLVARCNNIQSALLSRLFSITFWLRNTPTKPSQTAEISGKLVK